MLLQFLLLEKKKTLWKDSLGNSNKKKSGYYQSTREMNLEQFLGGGVCYIEEGLCAGNAKGNIVIYIELDR